MSQLEPAFDSFAHQQIYVITHKIQNIWTTSIESLQMHTKNANNCCARTVHCVDFSMYIIWLWLEKWILLFVFCQRVPFGLAVRVENGKCEERPASYLTFHVQFSINCIWIALRTIWMQVQTMRFENHCFGMNGWMSWLMDKEPILFERQQKVDQKECTLAGYLILYIFIVAVAYAVAYAENADARGVAYFRSSSELPDHPFTVQRTAIFHHFLIPFMPKDEIVNNTELSWAELIRNDSGNTHLT